MNISTDEAKVRGLNPESIPPYLVGTYDSTWQSIFEMTRRSSEATSIWLHAFIFLCRSNPWAKYPRNSIFFLILKEC